MRLIRTIAEMRTERAAVRARGAALSLVPTMGALHEGHISLVRAARAGAGTVAASIFVNPTQFGPSEDFSRYPRDLGRDCELLEREGVDLVFVPAVDEMYPPGASTWVTVEGMSDRLCGRSRPGHFRGVTTVVAKLFHIVQPDIAFFGQKDAAQVAIIKRMVRDLNLPVRIEVCPIVRDPDGLAISSRNAYLTPTERQSAVVLRRVLKRVEASFDAGEHTPARLIALGCEEFAKEPGARLDYLEVVDPDTLEPVTNIDRRVLLAIAAFVGNTRLIDNVPLQP